MKTTSGERDLYRILQVDPAAHPRVVQAAYRALARMHHPDQTGEDASTEMAVVNRAYAVLRDPDGRRAYDRERATGASPTTGSSGARPPSDAPQPERPAPPAASRSANRGTILPHGRYAGWTLEQLVRHDPDYLRWLARHTSGLRYRAEIARLLSPAASPAERAVASGRRRR